MNLILLFIGLQVEFFEFLSRRNFIFTLVCGHHHLFDLLVQYGAPIHTADTHGAFPIHYASQLCGIDIKDGLNIGPDKGIMKFQGISF